VSSVSTPHPFPFYIFRGVPALIACYIVGYNVLYDTSKNQWWIAAGFAAFSLVVGFFDVYDREMGDGFLGPMKVSNIMWLVLVLGVPVTTLVCGIIEPDTLAIVVGACVMVVNLMLLSGFRERGLPGTITVASLAFMALLL